MPFIPKFLTPQIERYIAEIEEFKVLLGKCSHLEKHDEQNIVAYLDHEIGMYESHLQFIEEVSRTKKFPDDNNTPNAGVLMWKKFAKHYSLYRKAKIVATENTKKLLFRRTSYYLDDWDYGNRGSIVLHKVNSEEYELTCQIQHGQEGYVRQFSADIGVNRPLIELLKKLYFAFEKHDFFRYEQDEDWGLYEDSPIRKSERSLAIEIINRCRIEPSQPANNGDSIDEMFLFMFMPTYQKFIEKLMIYCIEKEIIIKYTTLTPKDLCVGKDQVFLESSWGRRAASFVGNLLVDSDIINYSVRLWVWFSFNGKIYYFVRLEGEKVMLVSDTEGPLFYTPIEPDSSWKFFTYFIYNEYQNSLPVICLRWFWRKLRKLFRRNEPENEQPAIPGESWVKKRKFVTVDPEILLRQLEE